MERRRRYDKTMKRQIDLQEAYETREMREIERKRMDWELTRMREEEVYYHNLFLFGC